MGMDVEKSKAIRISSKPPAIQIMTDQKQPESVE
jgi:hypothetical protein